MKARSQSSIGFVALALSLAFTLGTAAYGQVPSAQLPLSVDLETWSTSDLDAGSHEVRIRPEAGPEGGPALELAGQLPEAFGASYRCWQNWEGYRRLTFRLRVPPEFPPETDLQLYLKDHHYWWYQTYPLHDPRDPQKRRLYAPGQWMTISVSLAPFNTDWQPGGHQKVWYDVTYKPKEFGLRFFGQQPWSGSLQVADPRLEDYQPPLGKEGAAIAGLTPAAPGPVANAEEVPQYEKFELTWPVEQYYTNPYDPQVVEVEGHFLSPSGQAITISGFFYQGYKRHRTEDGYEKLTPTGTPQWKVRFGPREQGRYRYYVLVRDALGMRRSTEGEFEATAPLHPQGYVQVSERDPHYFEFENGDFFYPFVINMRDGGDQAEAQAGTYAFEHFFPLFRRHGINVVRTWMCAWWTGIEWSQKYHSRFAGLGRYSQYNTWRLDHVLDLAAENALYLEITLGSHGQLRRDKFDAEWEYNPFAVENGGYLPAPFMFFTSPRAQTDLRQRYRYIIARWGYSRNIFAWDLWNEIDLSEGYYTREVAQWHREMAGYLRQLDPNPHLITSHICLYWSFGDELWQLPEIEYIQSDSYWKRRDEGMNESFARRQNYNKPFIFIEYGPKTADLPVPESTWLQEFRGGMWVSALMPWSAPGAFWYHQEWEQYRMWEFQKGLQAFLAGEDRRGRGLRLTEVALRPETQLRVQAMQNQDSAYLYVYDYGALGSREPPPAGGRRVTAQLSNLRPGEYRVEFWNTLSGHVESTAEIATPDGNLAISLPPVPQDLAVKIKRLD